MKNKNISRRDFLKGTGAVVAGVAAGGFPTILKAAAPKEILIGAVEPLTGNAAEAGQMATWGLELAIDQINKAGGIKSMGGAKLALKVADSESKNEVGAMNAEKLIRQDIVCLVGAFLSGVTMAVSKVADRQNMPFVIDVSTADHITQQGFQRLFRVFPTTTRLLDTGLDGIVEITKAKPIRKVIMFHISEFQGKSVTDLLLPMIPKKGLKWEVIKTITYPENAMSLASEVGEAKSLKPDALLVVARQRDAIMLVQEMYKQRFDVNGIFGMVSPGFADPGYQKEKLAEYSWNVTPWHDEVQPFAKKVAEEYQAKYKKPFIMNAAYPFDTILVIADALERAKSTDKDALTKALKETRLARKTSIGTAIEFDDKGDNKGASGGLMQIQQGKGKIVFPAYAAMAKPVYPAPLWKDRK
jgi:branched-chain amino acid transport system substrate-binding protein